MMSYIRMVFEDRQDRYQDPEAVSIGADKKMILWTFHVHDTATRQNVVELALLKKREVRRKIKSKIQIASWTPVPGVALIGARSQ